MRTFFNKRFGFFSTVKNYTVSLFPGDGIGPEICSSVKEIFSSMKLPINWQTELILKEKVNEEGDLIAPETLQNLKNNKFALKGK
jgi:isocitrate dehydrogenase (NAD+)